MNAAISWHKEFVAVLSCTKCTLATDRNLLRDDYENVPQPGYIGANYENKRVMLIGQNPGTPKTLAVRDRPYTAALRALRDDCSPQRYAELERELIDFIPKWPVHGNFFPLAECGLTLEDIAYCNVVRCRTSNDAAPNDAVTSQCMDQHLLRWLRILQPRVVVFIGKWAWRYSASAVESLKIPNAYMNRQRSLPNAERIANRRAVVSLVNTSLA